MSERLLAVLNRIAVALEAQNAADLDNVLTYPHSAFANFDWSSIGASIVQSDADGVCQIKTASGRIATRRSHEKYGTDFWFSYAVGKDGDKVKYHKVVEFVPPASVEPLSRKVEQAVKAATPAAVPPLMATTVPSTAGTNTSPLMPHLLERYQTLAKELDGMGELVPADLTFGIDTTPPIAQGVLDKLSRYVAQKRDSHRPPGHSAPAGAGDGPLAAAKAWLADSGRRANADNMTAFAAELQRHMTACGCVLTTKEPNLNRKRDAFAAWILEQVPA